jgi:hypothetical protein
MFSEDITSHFSTQISLEWCLLKHPPTSHNSYEYLFFLVLITFTTRKWEWCLVEFTSFSCNFLLIISMISTSRKKMSHLYELLRPEFVHDYVQVSNFPLYHFTFQIYSLTLTLTLSLSLDSSFDVFDFDSLWVLMHSRNLHTFSNRVCSS